KVSLPVVEAAPGVLTYLGGGQAAALNQDGSVNDLPTAAPAGSIVSLFAIGCGPTVPPAATGEVAAGPAPLALRSSVTIAGRPAEVLYAGAAPGLVGVTQFNVRVPVGLPLTSPPERVSVMITVAGGSSRTG